MKNIYLICAQIQLENEQILEGEILKWKLVNISLHVGFACLNNPTEI